MRDPVSTLPKPRPLLGEMQDYGQSKARLRTSVVGLVRPASAHGAGGERGGGSGGGGGGGGGGGERGGVSSLSNSPHHCALNMGFPLSAEVKVRALIHRRLMSVTDRVDAVRSHIQCQGEGKTDDFISHSPSPVRLLRRLSFCLEPLEPAENYFAFSSLNMLSALFTGYSITVDGNAIFIFFINVLMSYSQ